MVEDPTEFFAEMEDLPLCLGFCEIPRVEDPVVPEARAAHAEPSKRPP